MAVSRFDVYLISLDPTIGREIKKTRPFLIEAWANRLQVGKLQAG